MGGNAGTHPVTSDAVGSCERNNMSIFDGTRLRSETFKLDISRMRRGWYSDKYFGNVVTLLAVLAEEGYTFGGADTGDVEVEMQWFTRRQPFSVIAGVDKALAMPQRLHRVF